MRSTVRSSTLCLILALGSRTLDGGELPSRRPNLAVSDVVVSQERCGPHRAVFTVTLSPSWGSLRAISVHYATADGTALAGTDYTAVTGNLTFVPRFRFPSLISSQRIAVPVADVAVPGSDKTFILNLSNPVGAILADAQGVAAIHPPSTAKCDDGDACTHDVCDPLARSCRHVNRSACGAPAGAPVCALAGLGVTPQPDPDWAACNAAGKWLDSDGDGLSDAAEIQGYIDVDCNGVYDPGVDLALPGANPTMPDVYLHYDYVAASDHEHNPPAQAMQYVVDAFATHGASLHIDPQHTAIDEAGVKVVTRIQDPPDPACAGPSAASMQQLRRTFFASPNDLAYHYMVFSHWSSCDSVGDCGHCPADPECGGGQPPFFGALGSAEIGGDDAIVSLGPAVDSGTPVPLETWAGLTMHELGHNLGLFHGGPVCDNYKPNYISVMNYAFYTTGIGVAAAPGDDARKPCATDADCPTPAHCSGPDGFVPGTCFRIDYSGVALPDLNEFASSPGVGGLDETTGLGGPPTSTDVSYYSPDGLNWFYLPTNGAPIDWDHSGFLETHVTQDVNIDGAMTLLTGWSDWATDSSGLYTSLNLAFQCTNNFADAAKLASFPGFAPRGGEKRKADGR